MSPEEALAWRRKAAVSVRYSSTFPELLRTSGGEFGPGFDRERVGREVVGTAAFTWTACGAGFMDWTLDAGVAAERFEMKDGHQFFDPDVVDGAKRFRPHPDFLIHRQAEELVVGVLKGQADIPGQVTD